MTRRTLALALSAAALGTVVYRRRHDLAAALTELLAYVGEKLSEAQDAVTGEGYLETEEWAMPGGWARPWLAAWPGAAVIGITNGALREGTYGRRLPERRANQLSGVTLALALGAYVWGLNRRWPLPSSGGAARIGACWVVLTVAFEFGFGRCVEKRPWSEMLAAYNLAKGESWPLVVAWIGTAPAVVRRLQARYTQPKRLRRRC